MSRGDADAALTGAIPGSRPASDIGRRPREADHGATGGEAGGQADADLPERLACLSRFQRVRDAIWADPTIDLAGLAIEAGYSDQPHMTRHFRRYAGQTPAQFARSSVEKKKWLAAEDVAFVQEGGAGGD